MIKPPLLKSGDKVGIVAPARKIGQREIEAAQKQFFEWGLSVTLSENLFSNSHSYLSGSDEERLRDFQSMLEDQDVKAVFCARGGYGSTRIIDQLNFNSLLHHPKWIIGFSDITSIHLKISMLGIESIHGTMPVLFSSEHAELSVESLRKLLFKGEYSLSAAPNSFNRQGELTGRIIGGNLSLLVDALGTRTEPDTDGKIMVIEEIDEHLYKIDRMLQHLKRAGKFDKLAGLVIGHMTNLKDTELKFGEQVEEIVLHAVDGCSFPVGFNFPTGHENPNLSWIHGGLTTLSVSKTGSSLVSVG